MCFFVKGLVDTDGSMVLLKVKQRFYPRVQITSISKFLIYEIGKWLETKEIPVSISMDKRKLTHNGETKVHLGYRFQISGEKNLEKWMDLIGFRNKRHLDKYQKFKKNGIAGI